MSVNARASQTDLLGRLTTRPLFTDKRQFLFACTAGASVALTTLSVSADSPSPAAAPSLVQPQAAIDQQINQQRAFVANAIEQSQTLLATLLQQSRATTGTDFVFVPGIQTPSAERVSNFVAQQSEFISDYADAMRQRNAQIAGDFSDYANLRAGLFFQTGSIFGLTGADSDLPQSPSPIVPPAVTRPFPGLIEAPAGGFFALLDHTP